jgi:hypothetical protein
MSDLKQRVSDEQLERWERDGGLWSLREAAGVVNHLIGDLRDLRDMVRFFVNQTKGTATDRKLNEFASFQQLKELTEYTNNTKTTKDDR